MLATWVLMVTIMTGSGVNQNSTYFATEKACTTALVATIPNADEATQDHRFYRFGAYKIEGFCMPTGNAQIEQ